MVAEVDFQSVVDSYSKSFLPKVFSTLEMSNLSRTPVQSRNTLDPCSYDSDDNSGELVDRLRQDEEILGVHVDLISQTPSHIRFDKKKS